MHAILGIKKGQTQAFLTDGTRIPVTQVEVMDNPVVMVKTQDKDGYIALQLGYGTKKNAKKPQLGHSKKGANLDTAPSFLHEVRFAVDTNVEELPKAGEKVQVATVLEAGDIVDVTGTSKGKGFAGVVKRHNFRGGPRTHGQSDRERAPGSIGQTTTPGRVYKGKRMAGKMGNDTVTVKNLEIVEVTPTSILIKGLVPGVGKTPLVITKVGKAKNFVALVKDESEEAKAEEMIVEAPEAVEEVKVSEEPTVEVPVAEKTPTIEESKEAAVSNESKEEEENSSNA